MLATLRMLVTPSASRLPATLTILGLLAACGDDTGGTPATDTTQGETSSSEGSGPGPEDSTSQGPASTTDPDGSSTSTADDSSSGAVDETTTTTAATESSTTTDAETSSSSSGIGESGDTTTESTSAAQEESTTENGAILCPAGDLGMTVPASVAGSTADQDDEFSGSCGGGSGPDMAFTFTAPADGAYTFDTLGSSLDTILYVLDGECSGQSLGCNDDGIGSDSVVSVDLVAGQTVTAVVDGFLVGGAFELHVDAGGIACPRADLGSTVPQNVSDDNSVAINQFALTCGSANSPDLSYTFTAPADGDYLVDTFGSSFDTVLGVLDGTCGGSLIACNNDSGGGQQSSLIMPLVAGQDVTFVVEGVFGTSGPFNLNIGQLSGMCPDSDLGDVVPVLEMGTLVGADNTTGGSCGGIGGPDETFSFTAPVDGIYTMSTAGSNFDTALFVRDGGCNGAELACSDDSGASQTSSLSVGLAAGQSVIVVVDSILAAGGDYELAIDVHECPGPALVDPLPLSTSGSTVGFPNEMAGTCGGGSAPETTYTFTAPADGTYIFDTNGSTFDTVLYVLNGASCAGPQLDCDDDGGNNSQSLAEVVLAEGQTVTIVVDGDSMNSGDFTLNITQEAPPNCGADEDLGMALPVVEMGSTVGLVNDLDVPCGTNGNAPDVIYTWTAPAADFYQIDTNGSTFDTVLHVYDGTDACGMLLSCDDDTGVGTQSLLGVNLAAGQTIAIVVDGYSASSGNYTLNILAP